MHLKTLIVYIAKVVSRKALLASTPISSTWALSISLHVHEDTFILPCSLPDVYAEAALNMQWLNK